MRRKLLPIIALGLLTAGVAGAQSTFLEEPFVPMSPEVMGQGGSFVANAHGYNALFYNPAGFAAQEGSLTVASASSWVYANPARFMTALGESGPDALAGFVEDEITRGGVGFGFSSGIGFVGRGLGLAAVMDVDSYLWGPTILGASGEANATLAFVAGLALPLNILGMRLTVGGDVRPMVRISAPFEATDAFSLIDAMSMGADPLAALNGLDALHGFGFGMDLGTILELGSFKIALAARDFLGTRFFYTRNTLGEVLDSLSAGGFPDNGTKVEDTYLIPMNLSAGAAWHPTGGLTPLLDPTIHVSLNDVIGVIRDKRSPWTLLHIGAEVRLLKFLKLRGGFNQGYATLGAGAKLLFLDLNMAVFTREMGKYIGDRPNSGMTVEAAIRF